MNNNFNDFAKDRGLTITEKTINGLTPYILEEREMRVTQMDVFSRLMRDRIIWVSGVVNEQMADIVQAQLLYLDSVETKDISMYINTPGGSVPHGLGIVDVMEYIKSDVATMNLGMCASMGSVLLSAGAKGKRSSLKFSKVMLHQVSHGTQGNIQETRISHEEGEKYNFLLFKKLGQYTDKTWKQVLTDSKRDKWFTSDEALEYGLIDEVIIPDGTESISEMMKDYKEYKKFIEN